MKLLLKIAYDGRKYHGLIDQPEQNTVYSQIRSAMHRLKLPHSIKIECSGRTDKGVSAANMVLSLPIDKLGSYDVMFNNVLPDDIKVKEYAIINSDFSARFDCTRRVYRYFFHCENVDEYERAGKALKEGLNSGKFHIRDFCTKSVERNFIKKMKKQSLSRMNDGDVVSNTRCKEWIEGSKRLKCDKMDLMHTKELPDGRVSTTITEHYAESVSNMCSSVDDQPATQFDQSFYDRNIDYLKFEKLNEIYYMEIASKSFLHNQIRRMFYFIKKNVGKKEVIFYEGLAEPEYLVFYQAHYDKEIEWKKSRKDNLILYEIEKEKHKMMFFE
ncbi:tRNA pseudouridine synthase A [Vavraia culicis subsp. floridensis]|uniref:tRNA pseudouridine synthase A n=1 Tax=Vavraia culicis (isolate floridensis) TaxID=948595 RepID=L2GW39_VAVCU|nr:tRNA pseudouridine synthase A [Vavraia culicis subsp. floridensis]ELA47503.1 tRNA pseudouridine synthase A [Vavraia culicis subsp. floridensis]